MLFDNEEENKLEYTQIHKEFKELSEGLIEGLLKETGADNEAFAEAFEKAEKTAGFSKVQKIFDSIESFTIFKKMMLKKNADLNREAEEMLRAQEESLKISQQQPQTTTPQKEQPVQQEHVTPDGKGSDDLSAPVNKDVTKMSKDELQAKLISKKITKEELKQLK